MLDIRLSHASAGPSVGAMQKIAFLGLGTMGLPMARRLLAAGHPLTVWNRTPYKAGPLVAEGARLADGPGEAVAGADVVITMLADPAAARAVAAPSSRPCGRAPTGSTPRPSAPTRSPNWQPASPRGSR